MFGECNITVLEHQGTSLSFTFYRIKRCIIHQKQRLTYIFTIISS